KDYIEKQPADFITLLNNELGLRNARRDAAIEGTELIGIDDALIPLQLAKPYAAFFDQKSNVAPRIKDARDWAEMVSARLAADFAASVKRRIVISGVLEFLGIHILSNKIDAKVNEQFNQYHDRIIDNLVPLKLLTDKEYLNAELQKKKE